MPRRPRVLLANYPLHIVQRGINREPCFFTDEDYYCYLHWLEESARAGAPPSTAFHIADAQSPVARTSPAA